MAVSSFARPTDSSGSRLATLRARLTDRRRARAARSRGSGRRATLLLTLSLAALLGLFALALEFIEPEPASARLTLDRFSALADEGRLRSVQFLDEDAIVVGTFDAPRSRRAGAGERGAGRPADASRAPAGAGDYWVTYPESDALTAVLFETAFRGRAEVSTDRQTTKQSVRIAATFLLPLMILANLFALLFTASRGGSSTIGEVMSFGTLSRRKRTGGSAVRFSDVAGADEAVAELAEVRDYLRDPSRYQAVGASPPKGVLLVGPPGCGKTPLAKAVAGEADVPFFSVAGAEFVESLVGVGAARVRDLFARVRTAAPAIVFIDELDAAGRRRGYGGGTGGTDEREQTLNQLLVEMDGFDVSSGIVVMAATNRPDILDPALLRPGRFDRHVSIDQPDARGRTEILALHARPKPLASDVDFELLARRTPGFSGADLANVVNEAALLSVRGGRTSIDMATLEEAVRRVEHGPAKRGAVLSEDERRRAAYHESGHAVVAAALGNAGEVHRVSILARGKGLGAASLRRDTDTVLQTRSELVARLVTLLGGLASEQLVLSETSTGVEQDLEQATDIARDMIARFGMGSRRRRLLGRDVDEFIGGEVEVAQLSEVTHAEMETEIDRLLADAETEATRLLERHRALLDELAGRLQAEEHLEGAELETLLGSIAGAGSAAARVAAKLK